MVEKKDMFDPYMRDWWYWSSTSYVGIKSHAWGVLFYSRYVNYYYKTSSHYVRCVRGG